MILSSGIPGVLGYIGPGAGLGLLGALIGLALAVASALLFVAIWPVRMLIRRMKGADGVKVLLPPSDAPPAK